MTKLIKLISVSALSLAFLANPLLPEARASSPRAHASPTPAGVTRFFVYNSTLQTAQVGLICQMPGGSAMAGCPTQISTGAVGTTTGTYSFLAQDASTGLNVPITQYTPANYGWFALNPGQKVQIYSNYSVTNNYCMAGLLVSFSPSFIGTNSLPGGTFNQCPCTVDCQGFYQYVAGPNVPNGVNAGEVTLNATTGFEAADITCLDGANSTIQLGITPPTSGMGPYWTLAGSSLEKGVTAQNSWVDIASSCDNNCESQTTKQPRPGVFPYGCTTCTAASAPIPCPSIDNGNICTPSWPGTAGCQYQRAGTGSSPNYTYGGDVTVTYVGPLSPPTTLPNPPCSN